MLHTHSTNSAHDSKPSRFESAPDTAPLGGILPDWSGDQPNIEPERVALYLADLGHSVLPWPCRPDHVWTKGKSKGQPRRMSWSRATTNAEQVRRWRRQFWSQGYSVAIITAESGMFVLDADSKEAERIAGGLAFGRPTFTVDTKRGRHRYYLRSGMIRPDDRRNYAGELAPKLDVVCGLVKAFGPGKRWACLPDEIAAPTVSLEQRIGETIGEIYTRKAEQEAEAEARRAEAAQTIAEPIPVDKLDLARKYAARALELERQRVAATPEGAGRHDAIYSASAALFELVANPDSGIAEADVWRAVELGAEANGYTAKHGIGATRDHIRRGRDVGLQNPRDLSGIGTSASRPAPAPKIDADAVRTITAELLAGGWDDALAELVDPDTGKRVHPMRRETLRLVGLEILRRMMDAGQAGKCVGYATIAEAIGRGIASVHRAVDLVNETGVLSVERGGMGEDGTPKATLWRLVTENRQVGKPTELHTARIANALSDLTVSSDPLTRGLRSMGRKRPDEPPDPTAPPCLGPVAHRTRAALERAGAEGLTYADLAADAGVSQSTAERHVRAYAAAGVVELDREQRQGSAGRARLVARWVGAVTDRAHAAIRAGVRIIERLRENAQRFREQCADAKRMAETGQAPNTLAALRMLRERDKRRRDAELAAASGEERGRPSSADPEPFRRSAGHIGQKIREGVELGLTAAEAGQLYMTGTLPTRPAPEPLPVGW